MNDLLGDLVRLPFPSVLFIKITVLLLLAWARVDC